MQQSRPDPDARESATLPPPSQPPASRPAPTARPVQPRPDLRVLGIGASAGGLDACGKLLDALGSGHGMACVIVQHLDPDHQSMMAGLLAVHTTMVVQQASNGMRLEREHVYVIAPGTYLSVENGVLCVSPSPAGRGARLPFDFLLQSLARSYGDQLTCVILSGTGADGTAGLQAVKQCRGLIIAQDPDEAEYDGMPRSAIATGLVDQVLRVALIPERIERQGRPADRPDTDPGQQVRADIIELLRRTTAYDFTAYKPGTLSRRIERRMAVSATGIDSTEKYLSYLQDHAEERVLLAKDLLINVTGFFRDPSIFEFLAEQVLPELLGRHAADRALRVWVVGCSTGQEAYSLAMLLSERIAAAKLAVKLQIFASDVDPDAIAVAREGLYGDAVEAQLSPQRLARFFSKEEQGYRVRPELRAAIVFTVHDVLTDPPFSRIDVLSCRNLLIYVTPPAQERILSLLHFALRESGILLLGSAETADTAEGRFEELSKQNRLYRHIGRRRQGNLGLAARAGEAPRLPARPSGSTGPSRQTVLAELCRRVVLESYAPAAALINVRHECLYLLGPTDKYLQVAPGHPTHDLLSMARRDIRGALRSAISRSATENVRVVVAGGRSSGSAGGPGFGVAVQPVLCDGEQLFVVCFVDDVEPKTLDAGIDVAGTPRVAELERELEATRTELQAAIRSLEHSGEEQKAINDEALSFNEEYQSTNEELVTSKEELQALNEELSALNSELQETLERQRTTSSDLRNILYSTEVATIFLDTELSIRFFTPATKLLFSVIAGDVGRPLSDLNWISADDLLLADARAALGNVIPLEREVEARTGAWYSRRVLPYHAIDGATEGVVVTYTDISERKRVKGALEAAKQHAEQANLAKSRFLAAVSHDLRQPLQTLALIQGLLAKKVVGPSQQLVAMLDPALGAMSGMLNTLLDIDQIETGAVRTEFGEVSVAGLFEQLRAEFLYYAQAQGLQLRVVQSSLLIRTDRRLLERMLRNLLSNAIKYTRHGKVLIGCRRGREALRIEVWDTGIGIPAEQLGAIFTAYHQLDNAARERSRGLGLGLSIVQRLGEMLGHPVRVRSSSGRGSMFSVEVALAAAQPEPEPEPEPEPQSDPGTGPDERPGQDRHAEVPARIRTAAHRTGTILVIEDDPDLRQLLELVLTEEGHRALTAADGVAALELADGDARPALILADYNLPNALDGLQAAAGLRERLGPRVPVIILTGDVSAETVRDIASRGLHQLKKPVKLDELTRLLQRLLPPHEAARPAEPAALTPSDRHGPAIVYVVDDDANVRESLRHLLEEHDQPAAMFASCEAFLESYRPGREACLLIDAYLPGMQGLELMDRLRDDGHALPTIVITGSSDVAMAVRAMKAGALDFIEKPIGGSELLDSIGRALDRSRGEGDLEAWQQGAAEHLATLTGRQHQIMQMVLAGQPSKNIASDLRISRRTVENHRASIMKKTGCRSLPALARLAVAAGSVPTMPRR